MYESSVMLKPKYRKTHIVSSLFDTIHKKSHEEEKNDSDIELENELKPVNINKYIVSVPNERLALKNEKPLMICTYQVRTDGLYPFLMFLFKTSNDKACFIRLETKKQIKNAAIDYMQTILPFTELSYAGFYESAENSIIILSAEESSVIQKDYIGSQDYIGSLDYIWATSFEIVNKKYIINYKVDPIVIAFFFANPAFLILKDEGNCIYESPMVGYTSHENTCAEAEMDIYRETRNPSLGKCYYLDIDIPKTSASIMRIAFFSGKMVIKKEKDYDSFLCSENKCYAIQNYNHHVVLSAFRGCELGNKFHFKLMPCS